MKSHNTLIEVISTEKTDFIDITKEVLNAVEGSDIKEGLVNIFTNHTTTAVRINENEPWLIQDLKKFFEKTAPQSLICKHDRIDERPVPEDEQINGHSHIKSIILGSSETVPITEGKISLGTWQSILLVDFDGPRKRKVMIKIIGK